MKRVVFSCAFMLAAVLFLDDGPAISARICNRIVAIVNDEVITLHELNRKIKEVSGVDPSELESRDREGFMKVRRQIIDMMIDEKLAEDKVKELEIEVTPKEIDAAVERIKQRNHWTQEDLITGLNNEGITFEQYRKNLKKQLEQIRLIEYEVKSKIIIRDETIKKYYEDHLDQFRSNERVRLATILLLKSPGSDDMAPLLKKADEILTKLKNGEDFGDLARRYSQGPGAQDGGNLGFIKTSQLDPGLRKTIEHMAVGEVSKPIPGPSGIQIIKVMERESGGAKSFKDVKEAIHEFLYNKEVGERYSSWIKTLREKSYIKVIF
ncbi:MAG: hypothetical protein DRH37_01790 [Deltaproteobacteria bacterium]|nr:MAG: hypothetical protein DRH37_01790 [Deltaproteobacteria bacterium]